jgi:aspartyl-tRNA(Asn)/glutamyl-tRNA(Gln) amidotransferase subunit A
MTVGDATLDLPVVELIEKLDAGELRCLELTNAYLARIDRLNPTLNCFITVTAESAREDAARADAARANGRRGPLLGIPYAAKDIIDTAGIRTTWGTRDMFDRVPAADAAVIARLRAAGAVLLGKLSLAELANAFGSGYAEDNYNGICHNPWDLSRESGTSSSGSGCAVAAGLCAFALGTETWGSIDNPSACCGVTGLRPTYDLVSRDGVLALSWTLDKIGALCRDARDLRAILPVIASTAELDVIDPKRLRIGIVDVMSEPPFEPSNAPIWAATKELLSRSGAALEGVTLPDLPRFAAMTAILTTDLFAAFDGFIRAGHADHLFDRQPWSSKVKDYEDAKPSATDYVKAMQVRTLVQRAYQQLFATVDVIATFGTATLPQQIGIKVPDPKKPGGHLVISADGNLAGLPAITIPIGFTPDPLPRSLHAVAAPYEDHKLIAFAELFQASSGFHRRRPPVRG